MLVVRPEMLRVMFALIAFSNYEAKFWDVLTTFLNTLLSSVMPIYVRPPEGYEEYDELGKLLVWFLLCALYGLE